MEQSTNYMKPGKRKQPKPRKARVAIHVLAQNVIDREGQWSYKEWTQWLVDGMSRQLLKERAQRIELERLIKRDRWLEDTVENQRVKIEQYQRNSHTQNIKIAARDKLLMKTMSGIDELTKLREHENPTGV